MVLDNAMRRAMLDGEVDTNFMRKLKVLEIATNIYNSSVVSDKTMCFKECIKHGEYAVGEADKYIGEEND